MQASPDCCCSTDFLGTDYTAFIKDTASYTYRKPCPYYLRPCNPCLQLLPQRLEQLVEGYIGIAVGFIEQCDEL